MAGVRETELAPTGTVLMNSAESILVLLILGETNTGYHGSFYFRLFVFCV